MAEKNTSTLLIYRGNPCSSRLAQCHKAAHLAMEEVGVQVQIPAGQLFVRFLSSFMVFLPFGLFPFILFFPF